MVVQNGIVENFLELREELSAEGVEFKSDTDTETIVHLVEHYLATGLDLEAVARKTFQHMQGANVVVLMSADEPDKIVAARIGNAGGVVIAQVKRTTARGSIPPQRVIVPSTLVDSSHVVPGTAASARTVADAMGAKYFSLAEMSRSAILKAIRSRMAL